MHVNLRHVGNAIGVLIPKAFLADTGLSLTSGAEMTLEGGAIVLRKPAEPARQGWAKAAEAMGHAGGEPLVLQSAPKPGGSEW